VRAGARRAWHEPDAANLGAGLESALERTVGTAHFLSGGSGREPDRDHDEHENSNTMNTSP
jgi:hypothetical protein